MIFHIILNSFLVFLVLFGLIEIFIHLFQIKNARLRYLCRLLPIMKFPFDLLIFSTYGENLFFNLNPFSCALEVQRMLGIESSSRLSSILLPEYIASLIPSSLLTPLLCVSVSLSLLILAKHLMQFVRSRRFLQKLVKEGNLCNRLIINDTLREKFALSGCRLLTTPAIKSPCVVGMRTIFIPTDLMKTLTQEEFDAIVAHELEHARWKDPILRFISQMICAIFWWIPTQQLTERLEEDQEEASDHKIHRYGLKPQALASALLKTIKSGRGLPCKMAAVCPLTAQATLCEKRLIQLLQSQKSIFSQIGSYMGVALSLLAFFSFWAC